jgi:hypothetical protein
MIGITTQIHTPRLDLTVVNQEARRTADDIALHLQSQVKLALVRHKKIATGKTLQSVKIERTLDSPSRGVFLRKIVASKVWEFIQQGRRAGGKLPPESAMLEWFKALGIPKGAWFPIRLSIARRGIKPRKIRDKALRDARPYISARSSQAAQYIAKNAIK